MRDDLYVDQTDIESIELYAAEVEYAHGVRALRQYLFALNERKIVHPNMTLGDVRSILLDMLVKASDPKEKEDALAARRILTEAMKRADLMVDHRCEQLNKFLKEEILDFLFLFEKKKQLRIEGSS